MVENFYRLVERIGYTHPIHPTQINMPIGLAAGALIMALAALLFRKAELFRAAKYAVILAWIFIFPTVVAGFMDWQYFYAGARLPVIKVKIALAVLFFFLLLAAIVLARKKTDVSAGLLVLYAAAFATAVALGYFGGEIVFGSSTPAAPTKFAAGESVFRGNCSGCHAYGGNSLNPKKPLISSPQLGGLNSFIGWIRNPRDPMPAFGPESVPDGQAEELFAYLADLWARPPAAQPPAGGNSDRKNGGDRQPENGGDQIGARIGMTDNNEFRPERVTVKKGEIVRWENSSSGVHTVTADPDKAVDPRHVLLPDGAPRFDSGDMQPGETFTRRFEVSGLYRYFCIPHEMAGMIGEIEVK